MARRKSSSSKFMSQAAEQALVRYGPELSGLKELQRSATQTFQTGVREAQAGAEGTRAAIAAARPQVAQVYDQAGLDQARIASTLTGHDLAALTGPGADFFKAQGATEAAGAASRLEAARTAALTDLSSRSVAAKEGQTYAIGNAKAQFINDLSKILSRKQDLRGEIGAFKAATLGDLQGAQAKQDFTASQNAASRRNAANIAAGHDAVSLQKSKITAAAKGKNKGRTTPAGVKLRSPGEHATAKDKIDSRVTDAQAFAKAGISRHVAAASLVNGIPDQPVLDQNGKAVLVKQPDGTFSKQTKKGVQKWGNNLWTSLALDLAYDGHVSAANQRALWRQGLSVKQLGLPPASAANQQRDRQNKQGQQAGRVAAQILQGLGIGT